MILNNDSCPLHGIHYWLLSEANRCRLRGMSPAETEQRLVRATNNTRRTVPASEIRKTVCTAFDRIGHHTLGLANPLAIVPRKRPPGQSQMPT